MLARERVDKEREGEGERRVVSFGVGVFVCVFVVVWALVADLRSV